MVQGCSKMAQGMEDPKDECKWDLPGEEYAFLQRHNPSRTKTPWCSPFAISSKFLIKSLRKRLLSNAELIKDVGNFPMLSALCSPLGHIQHV